jgi:hypothetical protein
MNTATPNQQLQRTAQGTGPEAFIARHQLKEHAALRQRQREAALAQKERVMSLRRQRLTNCLG